MGIRVVHIVNDDYINNNDLIAWLLNEAEQAKTNGWDAHAPSHVIAKLAESLNREAHNGRV